MNTGLRNIYENYKKFYEDDPSGHDGICHDKELKGLIKQQLIKRSACFPTLLRDEMFETISNSLHRTQNYRSTLKLLIGAFELLELAAVNLFLYPWRKEFKTIKTFSGAYVHYLKPAICNEDLVRIFKQMGYRLKDNLQLEMKDPPHSLESIRLAFELLVTRIECEILLEIGEKLEHYNISVDELLRERKLMENIDACVDKLKVSRPAADRSQRERRLERTQSTSSSGENIDLDLKVNSRPRNLAGSPSQGEYDGSAICLSPWGLPRPATSDQYKDVSCSKHITGIPGTDSVPSFEDSQDLSRDRREFNFELRSPNAAENSLGGIGAENYKRHSCLANGDSALYCCETCCTVHTILCDAIKMCDGRHSLRIFDAESSTYLQKAEASNTEVGPLSYADILKANPNCGLCRRSSVQFRCKCGVRLCGHCGFRNVLVCNNCGSELYNPDSKTHHY
uniref:spermatogenesis associated 2-like n=1 Tax=Pristiophorus japonicus TaxID=55135 RepID=UPI00398EA471